MTTTAPTKRIHSIDLLRGTVMIIMALDHVRDYFHDAAFQYDPLDLQHTTTAIYFTRWITHFCAPIFTFLAGISAFLSAANRTKNEQAVFLITRGLWLIVADLLIITFAWAFNPSFPFYILGVIWAIGFGMIVLAGLIWLPVNAILVIGLALIFGHNLLDPWDANGTDFVNFMKGVLHEQHLFAFSKNFTLIIGYPVLPWIGIICVGYATGQLYRPSYDPAKRKKLLIILGMIAIALFAIIRYLNGYGDPRPWSAQASGFLTFLSFLDVVKYPPSLCYILMTLGLALIVLAFIEKPLNSFTQKIVTLGRVPMFYYILHLYLIHIVAMIAVMASGHSWHDMILDGWVTASPELKGYGYPLWAVYLIWMLLIIVLYPLCAWYDGYKKRNKGKWWLSYL